MKYTHLMLSGGGMYGYVYIGIYRFLKEFNLLKDIKYMHGTSIGSLFSFIYGLDLEYEHVESLFTTPYQYFSASDVIKFDPTNLFQIYSQLGAYSMRKITAALIPILEEKYGLSDITFCEYMKRTGKDLHINAVCINTGDNVDFCNDHYPDMSVLTAIDASMCIPFIFQPILYKNNLYIDGGTSNNLPLHMLPSLPGHKCLAVNLTIELEKHTQSLQDNFILYFLNVLYTVLKAASFLELENNKTTDVISINIMNIPIHGLHLKKINESYALDYPKEMIDKAILHGYEKIYYFYTSKYSSLQS